MKGENLGNISFIDEVAASSFKARDVCHTTKAGFYVSSKLLRRKLSSG
jgi:hypothetical protein